VKNVFVLEVER